MAELLLQEEQNNALMDEIAALQNQQLDNEAENGEHGMSDAVSSSNEAKVSPSPNEHVEDAPQSDAQPADHESKNQPNFPSQEKNQSKKLSTNSVSESSRQLTEQNRAEKNNHARGSSNQATQAASSQGKRRSEDAPQQPQVQQARPKSKGRFFGRGR